MDTSIRPTVKISGAELLARQKVSIRTILLKNIDINMTYIIRRELLNLYMEIMFSK